jgi:hypothetical protein
MGSVFVDPNHGKALVAALLIALGACLWALLFLYRLARADLGEEETRTVVALAASYPFAYGFSTADVLSLAFLTSTATFYEVRRRRLAPATGWAALAGLTWPLGWTLSVPLALIAARARGSSSRGLALVAAMPLVGMLAFSGFLYRETGRPFAWRETPQMARVTLEVDSPDSAAEKPGMAVGRPLAYLHGAAGLLTVLLIPAIARRFGPIYASYTVVMAAAAAYAGLATVGPVTALVFPTFLALAFMAAPGYQSVWLPGFALLQGFLAAVYFSGRPPV